MNVVERDFCYCTFVFLVWFCIPWVPAAQGAHSFLVRILFAYSEADLYQSGFHSSGLRNLPYYLSVKKLIPKFVFA